MSTFSESMIRRGQPDNAGKFRAKETSSPQSGLKSPSAAPVVPYLGEPVERRIGAPSELQHESTMVCDAEEQDSSVSFFAEEHQLEDGRYLTSIHYGYVVNRAGYDEEPDRAVRLETESFVSEEAGAFEKFGHLDRQPLTESAFRRMTRPAETQDHATNVSMAKRTIEDVWAYQMTFNRDPFAGSFDESHVDDFADALPAVRSAYSLHS